MVAKKAAGILSVLLMTNTLIYGQGGDIPQGRWNKVEEERIGTGLIVTVRGGEIVQGSLKSLSRDMLTVVTPDSTERKIPKTAVELIVTLEKGSGPIWKGALIGAAGLTTLCIVRVAQGGEGTNEAYMGIPFLILVGAGVGAGIDALIKSHVTLYKAPNQEATGYLR